MMGIVPRTIFSGTCAAADNPKLLADTQTERSAAAVLSASRRESLWNLTVLLPGRRLGFCCWRIFKRTRSPGAIPLSVFVRPESRTGELELDPENETVG